MDDGSGGCGHRTGAGDDGIANLDGCLRHGFALDAIASRALERSGHAGTHPQFVVGSIHVCLGLMHRHIRDITEDDVNMWR
jgi:hypothetical protein